MSEQQDRESTEFVRRTEELLARSAQQLPARIRSRLTRARYAALDQHAAGAPRRWARWLPAGAAAAMVLAVLIVQAPRPGADFAHGSAGSNEDIEMLADSGAYALAQDQLSKDGDVDYEFYDWAVSTEREERGGETGS